MPTLAEFFLFCVYLLIFSAVLAIAIIIVGVSLVEVRKRWPRG